MDVPAVSGGEDVAFDTGYGADDDADSSVDVEEIGFSVPAGIVELG
jgi:hypothetical protein